MATRAEINRANAQKSTGPKTPEGRARSSQNSFKHGIYSEQVVTPGEDPALFDELRAELRAEHQPATPTEEILVDELAQHFWRMNRFRRFETQIWTAREEQKRLVLNLEDLIKCEKSGLFSVFHRALAAAERSFHRTLTALTKLKKESGFVPAKSNPVDTEPVPAASQQPVNTLKGASSPAQVAAPATACAGTNPSFAEPRPSKVGIASDLLLETPPEPLTASLQQ